MSIIDDMETLVRECFNKSNKYEHMMAAAIDSENNMHVAIRASGGKAMRMLFEFIKSFAKATGQDMKGIMADLILMDVADRVSEIHRGDEDSDKK